MRQPWILACTLTVAVGGSVMGHAGPNGDPRGGHEAGSTPLLVSTQDDAPTAKARYEALEAQASEARNEWMKRARSAREAGEAFDETDPTASFMPRFQEAAKEFAGTEDAVLFLRWLAFNTMRVDVKVSRAAYMTLLRDHGTSPEMKSLASTFGDVERFVGEGVDEALGYLGKIAADHSDPGVKAWATYGVNAPTLDAAAIDSEEFLAAEAAVMAAIEGLDDDRLKTVAGRTIGVRKKFSLGMVAPDIEGLDLSGNSFKLSDYRGKVIFLDFWGDW